MDFLFQTALTYRSHLISQVKELSDEQWDATPEGFSSSIRWNIAHLVVTPSLLTYGLTGSTSPLLSEDFINSACKGTTVESFSLNEDFGKKHLCEYLIETVKQCQRDISDLENKDFKAYETSTAYIMRDLPSALSYSISFLTFSII